jgi:hypothetical protein
MPIIFTRDILIPQWRKRLNYLTSKENTKESRTKVYPHQNHRIYRKTKEPGQFKHGKMGHIKGNIL